MPAAATAAGARFEMVGCENEEICGWVGVEGLVL